ncbi:MAG: hypothetical protein KDD51_06020 [Bdellovibrionales bacterium]|nr:hypothetical protein [Bdellovibrionales bacterium]
MEPISAINLEKPLTPRQYGKRMGDLLESFCSLASREGYSLKPYDPSRPLEKYQQLPHAQQKMILDAFVTYYQACLQALEEGGDLGDSDFKIFWNILKRLGLRPSSDLFDRLNNRDVVEVYTDSYLQIYRNLRFLELCSYPLDHVFSYQWPELFERHKHLNMELYGLTAEILAGKLKGSVPVQQETHLVKEVFSCENRSFWVEHNFISPLYSASGGIPAFVFSLSAVRVNNEH